MQLGAHTDMHTHSTFQTQSQMQLGAHTDMHTHSTFQTQSQMHKHSLRNNTRQLHALTYKKTHVHD